MSSWVKRGSAGWFDSLGGYDILKGMKSLEYFTPTRVQSSFSLVLVVFVIEGRWTVNLRGTGYDELARTVLFQPEFNLGYQHDSPGQTRCVHGTCEKKKIKKREKEKLQHYWTNLQKNFPGLSAVVGTHTTFCQSSGVRQSGRSEEAPGTGPFLADPDPKKPPNRDDCAFLKTNVLIFKVKLTQTWVTAQIPALND